jgi:acetyl esterase
VSPRRPRYRLPRGLERAAARAFLSLPARALRRIVGPPIQSPEGYELDLQLEALLYLLKATGEPQLHEGGLERARRRMERSLPLLDLTDVPGVVAFDRLVGGAAGDLRARVYTPVEPKPSRESLHPMPALVWFHGGGFVMGSIESHDGVCRGLAHRAGVVVISVEYRLAPEHPFPAAADDAIASTRWILEHAEGLGVDPRAVAVGGDSAGGNLSAVVAQDLRHDALRPAFQLLVYPATDCTRSTRSHAAFRDGFILSHGSIELFMQSYLPDPKTWTLPKASPLYAPDVAGLPPAMILTAGFDPLRDEGDSYAKKMAAAGVPVEHVPLTGMLHGFFNMAAAVREADRALDRVAGSLRRALARPS